MKAYLKVACAGFVIACAPYKYVDAASLDVTFTGTLVRATCSISTGGTTNISFGNVDIAAVSKGNVMKSFPLLVACGGSEVPVAITLTTRSGTVREFVKTTVNGLLLQFFDSGRVWAPRDSIMAISGKSRNINVYLSQDGAATLPAGSFSSTITLSADYM